jgi:esterase/lipase
VRGHKKAIILIHGFLESPSIFANILPDLKNRLAADIYLPLLPYHGRNLEIAAQFNAAVASDFLSAYIDKVAAKYQSVTVLGLSVGGAILIKLTLENRLPKNVHIVLYSPAIYLLSNTTKGQWIAQTYTLWRKYCNYKKLSCFVPAFESADETARPLFYKEQSLQYKVVPALIEAYALDNALRSKFADISQPFDVIIAKDDNRVNVKAIEAACKENTNCSIHLLPSGKHLPHWGKDKKAFIDTLVNIVNQH